jgi:hypothetical protein
MYFRRKFTAVAYILVVSLTACNLPIAPQQLSFEDQAATVVAQPLQAQVTPGETSSPQATTPSVATRTATQTTTPTYSLPILKINASTNCRSGPGTSYEILTVLNEGDQAEIVGSYPTDNYWIVKNPDASGTCWIWGEYSSPTGSYWAVPSMTPPPTPTVSLPEPPRNLRYNYECSYNGGNLDVTTTLNWTDRANNELGYRIYRYDTPIAELPPDSTFFSDTVTVAAGDSLSYGVEAYNSTGASPRSTISFSCH